MAVLERIAVVLCLLWPITAGNVIDDMIPAFMDRMKEVREVMLPVPEDTLQEGLYHAGSNYIPLDSETELCRNHSSFTFENFLNYEMWALKMVDAGSKLPSGVLDGRITDLGNYDECLGIVAPGELFRGKMCVVETRGFLPDEINLLNPERPFLQALRVDVMFTVCVPSSCTARDVQTHLNVALNSVNASAYVYDNSCSSKVPEPFMAKEWIVLFFFALILAMVALSTAYENSSMGSEKNALLCAFSLTTNGRQMLSTKTSSVALTCLNGLRVIAMVWVMTGHRMIHMLGFPTLRPINILERIDTLPLAPVENTQLAVEIFFLMSGVLVTYGYLRYMVKGRKFNVLFFYLQRYCRLTPILIVLVAIHGTIGFRFTDGPLWRRFYYLINSSCDYNWWATLLYINNYYDPYNMCVQQSWFTSSDFQFYFFSPVVLIPLYKKPKLGLKLIGVFLLITTVGGFWNAIVNDLKGGGAFTFDRRSEDSLVKDYIVSHWRAASFLMGMALGYVLFKYKQGELILKLSRAQLWAGWLISTFFLLFSIFFITVLQDPEYKPNGWIDIPYMIIHRHMLSLGFAWIILACTLGHGGWVNHFLSWNVLIPFARLTYGAFLCHVMIQSIDQYSQRTPITLNLRELWYHVAADFTISYAASAVLFLTVEGPCSNLATLCFEGKKKSKEVPQNQTELPAFKYTA